MRTQTIKQRLHSKNKIKLTRYKIQCSYMRAPDTLRSEWCDAREPTVRRGPACQCLFARTHSHDGGMIQFGIHSKIDESACMFGDSMIMRTHLCHVYVCVQSLRIIWQAHTIRELDAAIRGHGHTGQRSHMRHTHLAKPRVDGYLFDAIATLSAYSI